MMETFFVMIILKNADNTAPTAIISTDEASNEESVSATHLIISIIFSEPCTMNTSQLIMANCLVPVLRCADDNLSCTLRCDTVPDSSLVIALPASSVSDVAGNRLLAPVRFRLHVGQSESLFFVLSTNL